MIGMKRKSWESLISVIILRKSHISDVWFPWHPKLSLRVVMQLGMSACRLASMTLYPLPTAPCSKVKGLATQD